MIEPVSIPRRRYQPLEMTPDKRDAMRAAVVALVEAYRPVMAAMVTAINAQLDNCGNKCTWTVTACRQTHMHMQDYVKELSVGIDPVEFPELPQIC